MAITASSILEIITRLGISASIRVYPSATFDPDTNSVDEGSSSDYDVKIIPPYKNLTGYGDKTELITSGKGWTGVANDNLGFTVKSGILITIDSKVWTVINTVPLRNSLGIVAYLLEIESGN